MRSDADFAVKPLQASTRVVAHLLPPEVRDTPQTLGLRSPVRLGIPGFLVSKVSQKLTALPNCKPQFPATGPGGGVDPPPDADPDGAEQLALAPPLDPLQLHVHGPEPTTDDAVPTVQRLADGADDAVVSFADPHAPLTGVWLAFTDTVVLAIGDVPPLPVHVSI